MIPMDEDYMSPCDMDAVFNEITRGVSTFSKRDIANSTGVIFSCVDIYIDRLVHSGVLKSIGSGLFIRIRSQEVL